VLRFARHEGPAATGPSFFLGPRPLPGPIYDGHATDEKFSAKPAGAGWVNGSPAIPMKLGLGSPGGDNWLTDQLRLPADLRIAVGQRWNMAGRPLLTDFAPYAHHCTRVLFLVLIGMRHKVLSARKTNRLDAEYLFYVPFCEVFVSGDTLHAQLAPMVLGEGRRFVAMRDFKAEMARYAAERLAPKV